MTKEDMKKKVAKLLALAIDQAGTPEGELASRKAMDIMANWGIQEGEVDPTKDGHQMTRLIVRMACGPTSWGSSIAGAVGRLTGLYVASGSGDVWLMGREIDTEIAAYLVDSLIAQCYKDQKFWRREQKKQGYSPSRIDGNVYKESWAAGLDEKVNQIIRQQQQASAADATSTALTVVNRRTVARGWAEDQWGFGKRRSNQRAWNSAGREAGRSANVQSGVGGKRTRQITS